MELNGLCNLRRGRYEEHLGNHFEFGLVDKKDISFKDIPAFTSGGHFFQQRETVCAI